MNILQLLEAIRTAEIAIRLEAGQVILSPASSITPEIAAYTAHHKEHLVWLLRRRLPDRPPHEVWLTPEVREEWLWLIGAMRWEHNHQISEAA